MVIPGTDISLSIQKALKEEIIDKNLHPNLAVIMVGDDASSLAYINRKKGVGEKIGVTVTIHNPKTVDELKKLVQNLNNDSFIKGIIIQRPLPLDIPKNELDFLVKPEKDVDGFHPHSSFNPPIGEAIIEILKWVEKSEKGKIQSAKLNEMSNSKLENSFHEYLSKKRILIIGRGETAGKPIAKTLKKINIHYDQFGKVEFENLKLKIVNYDILISCVGKPDIVRHDMVTDKTVLLGVGMHPKEKIIDSLHKKITFAADYQIEEIEHAAFYSPVPGGVGPVNVACLMKNVVISSQK